MADLVNVSSNRIWWHSHASFMMVGKWKLLVKKAGGNQQKIPHLRQLINL